MADNFYVDDTFGSQRMKRRKKCCKYFSHLSADISFLPIAEYQMNSRSKIVGIRAELRPPIKRDSGATTWYLWCPSELIFITISTEEGKLMVGRFQIEINQLSGWNEKN
jgi:hypothetical protein